tara:strand:+ start:499 stop:810 length:312 start_codon:yes stop_codon:yes gene_type:complete
MKNIGDALLSLVPGAEWVTDGEKVTQWLSPEIDQPTQSEIDAEVARLQAEYDAIQYQRDRKAEYPSMDEIVVALWEAVIEERMASSIDLQGKRTAVKGKYPKP